MQEPPFPVPSPVGSTRGQGRMLWGVFKFQPYLQRLRSQVENVSVLPQQASCWHPSSSPQKHLFVSSFGEEWYRLNVFTISETPDL